MSDVAPAERRADCPACGALLPFERGREPCRRCGAEIRVVTFTPLLDAASLRVGEGRCMTHSGSDAVDACERCGGFVCDVCVTRTGERVLCPPCFDLLHERGELDTTVNRRMRWDRLSLALMVVAACNPCLGVVPMPLVLPFAFYALWRRRREPYLGFWQPLLAILMCLVPATVVLILLLGRDV